MTPRASDQNEQRNDLTEEMRLENGSELAATLSSCSTPLPSIMRQRFVTTRCASDDISQFGPRRISGFWFQAW